MVQKFLIRKKHTLPLIGLASVLFPLYIIAINSTDALITTSISQLYKYSYSQYAILGNIGLIIFSYCMYNGIKNVISDRIFFINLKNKIIHEYKVSFIMLSFVGIITVDFEFTRIIHKSFAYLFILIFLKSSIDLYKGLKLSNQENIQKITSVFLFTALSVYIITNAVFNFDTRALFLPEIVGVVLLGVWIRLSYNHSIKLENLFKRLYPNNVSSLEAQGVQSYLK